MNSIFVIIADPKIERDVVMYTTSEYEAMQICAQHNAEPTTDESDMWIYQDVKQAQSPTKYVPLRHLYAFTFVRGDGGYGIIKCEREDYVNNSGRDNPPEVKKIMDIKTGFLVQVLVDAGADRNDSYDQARALAIRELHQHLYRIENNAEPDKIVHKQTMGAWSVYIVTDGNQQMQ